MMLPDTICWAVSGGPLPADLIGYFRNLDLMPSAAACDSVCLQPLWDAFPGMTWGSIGWRMGDGEFYKFGWFTWFATLSGENRALYMQRYPEPETWAGFYENVLSQISPAGTK